MPSQSDIKSTIRNATIYASVTVLEKAVGFVMLPFYAHLLGSEGYGIIGMIEIVTSVIGVVVAYGASSALYRFYFLRQTEADRKILVSTANTAQFFLSGIFCLPVIVLNEPIAWYAFGIEGLGLYVILAVVSFWLDTSSSIGQAYILIRQKTMFAATTSFLRFFLSVILNIYLIVVLKLGVLGVLYSGICTSVLFAIFFQVYVIAKTGIHLKREDVDDILKYSMPLLPGYIAMFVRTNADRVILRSYLGLAEIGIYSMVMKFSLLLGMLVHEPFFKTWSPKRMEICDSEEGPFTISRIFTLHLTIMLFVGLVLALEIPLIIKVLTPEEFWVPAIVAFFAISARVAYNAYYHVMFGLLYGKKTLHVSGIQVTTAVLSVGFGIVLIKAYGVPGAFISGFLVHNAQCLMAYHMAKKYYRVNFEWAKITALSFSAVLLFFLIETIDVRNTPFLSSLEGWLAPSLAKLIELLNLAHVKDGKLVEILTVKLGWVIEGTVKGLLAILFAPVPIALGVVPRQFISDFVRKRIPFKLHRLSSKTG